VTEHFHLSELLIGEQYIGVAEAFFPSQGNHSLIFPVKRGKYSSRAGQSAAEFRLPWQIWGDREICLGRCQR
jgi:hypothetical protein